MAEAMAGGVSPHGKPPSAYIVLGKIHVSTTYVMFVYAACENLFNDSHFYSIEVTTNGFAAFRGLAG